MKFLDQWNGTYPAIAFPHTLLWQGGGPDFTRDWLKGGVQPQRHRANLAEDEPRCRPAIQMGTWLAGMAKRVEHQVRSDWLFIPGMRNVHFRFRSITAKLGSIVRKKDTEIAADFTD